MKNLFLFILLVVSFASCEKSAQHNFIGTYEAVCEGGGLPTQYCEMKISQNHGNLLLTSEDPVQMNVIIREENSIFKADSCTGCCLGGDNLREGTLFRNSNNKVVFKFKSSISGNLNITITEK